MKILLIYPYCLEDRIHEEDATVVPIGLYYIAALLRENGHDAEVLNFSHLKGKPAEIREVFVSRRPDIIGFSVFNANRWGAIDLARCAKSLDPEVRVVFGGVGATFLWDFFLSEYPKAVDFTVMGEGEYPFLELVRCLDRKEPERLETIRGIGFMKEDVPFRTEPAEPLCDPDELPDPAQYFTFQHLVLTRGCPADCAFCGSPQFWRRRVRYHSTDYFVTQMERLYRRGVTFFFVSDDTFTLKKERTIAVCKEILARRLRVTWAAISRVDCVDETVLRWMRMAGCVQISYGVESGSEQIRRRLNKRLRTEDIHTAFRLTTRYGILARAYFIYGCPGESRETIRETLDLMAQIKPLSTIFYLLTLFPGTSLYEEFRRKFDIPDWIWNRPMEDILYFEYDPDLSREDVLAFGKTLRTEFYRHLPRYAEAVELIDDPALYPLHADFLSRLAMTFTHGDYARIEAIPDKAATAETLYRKALRYAPDHRAFLGLGMLRQQDRDFASSVRFLREGLGNYPESEPLHLCLAVSLMNMGQHRDALDVLLKFPASKQAVHFAAQCYQALGDSENAAAFARKVHRMSS